MTQRWTRRAWKLGDVDSERISELVEALERYREARLKLLGVLRLPLSNREPLTQWSEHLVAALLGGQVAESPVQPGWDVTTPAGEKVQVRSLTNKAGLPGAWVNEHRVVIPSGVHRYALVVFEGLRPVTVLMFPADLRDINAKLKKQTKDQGSVLELTRANYLDIVQNPTVFQRLGIGIWTVPGKA